MDLSLGRDDGIEVLEMLAAEGFAGGIVLMSGHEHSVLAQVHGIGTRLNLKMLAPLRKPFKPGALRAVLQSPGHTFPPSP